MEQYQITLQGLTPLLMHNDNLSFNEKIKAWQKAPENKANSVAGDDRCPPWTWIGYLYHDGKNIGVSSDNIMTNLREGGAKVIAKGKETYKKQTQSGIVLDQQQFDLYVNGNKAIARETAKRVSWAFLFNWLVAEEYNCEEYSRFTELNRYRYLTDGIKGEAY